jgi:hypothetical protein
MDPNKNLIQKSVLFGVIAGLLAVVYHTIAYKSGALNYLKLIGIYKFVPLFTIIILIGAFLLRKQQFGFINFQEGLKFSFLAFVCAELVMMVFTVILFNYIDTGFQEKVAKAGIEFAKEIARKFGSDSTAVQLDKDLASADLKKIDYKLTFQSVAMSIGLSLILDFILSLLISLIVKKEKPAFFEEEKSLLAT